jgi:tRNA (cmo5U34)-methyltransferase
MTQYHFDPTTYVDSIRADIPAFDEFQDAVGEATREVSAQTILELGTGTGETARRVLALHPGAMLVGIDESERMLDMARKHFAGEFRVSRLEDPLPEGPFDLAFSALAVHHLDGEAKRDLFRRVAAVLVPGGTFVLGDVIVPARSEDARIPLTPEFDRPDRLDHLLDWLAEAGFAAETAWAAQDLAVLRARRGARKA